MSEDEYAEIIATILAEGVACRSRCKYEEYSCCWHCDRYDVCDSICELCDKDDPIENGICTNYIRGDS